MTDLAETPRTTSTVRPFRIDVPQADRRPPPAHRRDALAPQGTRRRPVAGRAAGDAAGTRPLLGDRVRLAPVRGEAERACPQFTTEIDGRGHPLHPRASRHANALPLIMTHGWPGSVIELLEIVGPLTDPTAYGGTAEDAFHLVLPSMPGYGFSGRADRGSAGTLPHRAGLGGADATASATPATSPRAATWAPPSPTRWAAWPPRGCSASTSTCWTRPRANSAGLPAGHRLRKRLRSTALNVFGATG